MHARCGVLSRPDSAAIEAPCVLASHAPIAPHRRVVIQSPVLVGTVRDVVTRSCPDWPDLMEVAPELQFKHYTVAEAKLPADALMLITDVSLSDVEFCCDLDRNVFYGEHTPEQVGEALRASHWFELREWVAAGRPGEG